MVKKLNKELKRLDSAVIAANKDAHDAFKVVSDAAENDDWDAYDAALILFTEHTVYANAVTAIRNASYSNLNK